jgi:hypothetical protein
VSAALTLLARATVSDEKNRDFIASAGVLNFIGGCWQDHVLQWRMFQEISMSV